MTYYDHGSSMALRLGVWKNAQQAPVINEHSWVVEKEAKERRTESSLGRSQRLIFIVSKYRSIIRTI